MSRKVKRPILTVKRCFSDDFLDKTPRYDIGVLGVLADSIINEEGYFMSERKQLEQRQFTRHPSHVPLEVWQETESVHRQLHLNDVSLGGVAFQSDICWKPNTIIRLRVLVEQPTELAGRVVWCRQNGKRFNVGVELIEANSDSEDMVEQVRQIEMYQKMIAARKSRLPSRSTHRPNLLWTTCL